MCEKGLKCFYQHLDKEYGSVTKGGGSKDDEEVKRKRSNSNGSPPSVKIPRTDQERLNPAADPFLYERMAKLEKEVDFYRRNNLQQNPGQSQPMYMMAPNVAQAPPTPHSWTAVPTCPVPGGPSTTTTRGPWGNMMPSMTQFYQPSQ